MSFIFPDFSKSSVLIIGDVMVDRYYYGDIERVSSEAPVAIVNVNMIEDRPGGAANVAVNVAALGAQSKLLSVIGTDDMAHILKEKLRSFDVNYDFVDIDCPTIVKLRVLSNQQQLIRLDFEEQFKNIDMASFIRRVKLELSYANVLVLSDYNKGVLSSCVEEIIAMAREFTIPIIVDPKNADFFRYKGATLLTPNLSEFEFASGYHKKKENDLISRAMDIMLQCQLSAILLTRSEDGMTLFQQGGKSLHFPTKAREVFDVTGAGDTVVAVLAASLSSGKSLEESCFLANIAAGVVVSKLGTSVIYSSELRNVFNSQKNIIFGILCEKDLLKNINLARSKGEKIVLTNGVFDILHAGHVAYLSKARKLGDRLVVAVNSDFSTRRLKGNNRPINSLDKRMFVLSSLEMVDWVVPFYEDSPKRLIANLLPDFLVKGGDYKCHEIDGSQEVLEHGGQVYILDFELDCSTTNIINSLNGKCENV